jgi:hypothetical protein
MNTIASTILEQLGGGRFLVMTGAKNLVGSANALSFRVTGNCGGRRINRVKISLMPNDTYSVQVFAARGLDLKLIGWNLDIYVSQLRETFERLTGLYTSLK